VRLFCQDECRIGRMPITRRRVTSPGVKPVQTAQPAYEYFYLYGAVEPETGQAFFTEHERLNSECFQVYLDGFARAFPHSQNVMILDNGRFHKAERLTIPANVRLVFLPPYSPELNPVERVWQHLKDALGFAFYPTLADLRQRARRVVTNWTDEVLASLAGYDYLLESARALSI
jgi:transposase